jgi:hypothetical protein
METALKLVGIAIGLWVIFHVLKENPWRKMAFQTHDGAAVLPLLVMASAVAGLLGIIGLLGWSLVAPRNTVGDVTTSVASIRRYGDSFKGMSFDEARSRLADSHITESEWRHGEQGGRQLVGTFPSHRVRVLFTRDKAVVTSIEITSK